VTAQPVAIVGGTFDPIHIGHLRNALELRDLLGVDEVRLVPCHVPPHRETPDVSARERLEMVHLAIADEPGLVVDDRELAFAEPSYSVNTLRSLRAELDPQQPLIMAMGTDSFAGLDTWHEWQQLFDYAHILVFTRPDYKVPTTGPVARCLAERQVSDVQALLATPSGGILLQALRLLPVSATQIRAMVQRGVSTRYLVPDSVCDYIRNKGLYSR